jgi:hypothetical protein
MNREILCNLCGLSCVIGTIDSPTRRVDDPMNDFLLREGESLENGMERMGLVQLMERPCPPPWRPAIQRIKEDDWRTFKDEFAAEAGRRDAARTAGSLRSWWGKIHARWRKLLG